VYLDFGLVSEVPRGVREGLVRAVAYLVARDYDALANLFSDLLLIPKVSRPCQQQLRMWGDAYADLHVGVTEPRALRLTSNAGANTSMTQHASSTRAVVPERCDGETKPRVC
jgi:predicted unusual protein kinase regulating ubiquinone biosynthesis (AarF/ABC1/UbiB family)